jgi:hypothetical protein
MNIRGKSKLSANYTVERHAFPGYNSRKVKNFRRLDRGKARMSFRELFCIKAGFSGVKSAESQNFPRIILWNVSAYSGKSKSQFLKAYHYF